MIGGRSSTGLHDTLVVAKATTTITAATKVIRARILKIAFTCFRSVVDSVKDSVSPVAN